jgi:hypothetical protein
VLPTGRNFGRKTQKWPHKNLNGRKNLRPNFWQIFIKMAEKWPKSVIGIKALFIARNRLFNSLINLTFMLLVWPEVFEKQPLCKDNVCGRIFSLAAEFFGEFGRRHLPGVGNTVYRSSLEDAEIKKIFLTWSPHGAS